MRILIELFEREKVDFFVLQLQRHELDSLVMALAHFCGHSPSAGAIEEDLYDQFKQLLNRNRV